MAEPETTTGLKGQDEAVFKEMGYVFHRQIGSGSYAKVFLSEKTSGRNSVQLACKIIDAAEAPKEFTKKFLPRELDILSKVHHPNIIYIQGIFHRNGKILIFMQNAEEGDLLEYILKEQEISEKMAKHWSHQMLVALQYLHTFRIAHRDIKCENVLITRRLNAKLADFGFAKFVPSAKTLSKTYCGSIAYAAPEIMKGKPYQPIISDIWSLGVVIYVLFNKSLPFPLEKFTPKVIYKMQMTKQWKFRSKALSKYSAEAKDIVVHMLEPDVHRRPTAESLLLAEWFTVVDKGARVSLELTKYEKNALIQAEKAPVISGDAVLNTNKFDLLELKTDPFPSENVLVPEKPVVPEEREMREDSQGPPQLERMTELIDLKNVDIPPVVIETRDSLTPGTPAQT
uniref:Testis-specific serine/threonine-protein kinase 1 n=1 Tax=Lygus hesperus TaxID=30085 RepID=A0A0A9ZAR1_LYGHE